MYGDCSFECNPGVYVKICRNDSVGVFRDYGIIIEAYFSGALVIVPGLERILSAVKWQTVPVPEKQRLVRNRLLVENCLLPIE